MGEAGGDVVCVDIDGEKAQETLEKINFLGGNSVALECDVSEERKVKSNNTH